jgi:hypothetical protein
MRSELDDERRAKRLLRWYPPTWRERYGEEFVDHLEQEFVDRPVSLGRTINIACKGLVARASDMGLSNEGVSSEGLTRAALGTSFALIALMIVIMLDFWWRATLAWSGRRYHPMPVSATTGILTVAVGLLLAVLVAIVLTITVSVVRQIVRGRARPLVGPSVLAIVSCGFLLYVARFFPRMLAQYIHGAHGFQGIQLSRPGQFVSALAQITWELTQKWVAAWNQGIPGTSTIQTVVNDCVPITMFLFGVALALLIRRVELPRVAERFVFPALVLLGGLMGVFFVAYLTWSAVGGPSNYEYFFLESRWLGVVYLIFLALAPVLVVRSTLLASRYQPRRQRNHIEIVSSGGDLA